MGVTSVFRNLVDRNLSSFLYDNALFYSERLYYEDPSPENLNLLAQCFFQQGKLKQAYLLLKESDDKLNRYLLGLVCVQLKKYSEAEKALLPELYSMDPIYMTKHDIENIPGEAAGLYLLGLICRREHRQESAIFYFQYSLQMDPTLWSSICELSEMGVNIDLHKLFHLNENIIPEIRSSNSVQYKGTSRNDRTSSIPSTEYTSPRDKLEKRVVAESIQDPIHSSRALSLGLSSLALRIPFASPGTIYNNSSTRINAFNANANSAAVHTDLHLRHLENEQLGLGTTLRSGSRDVVNEETETGNTNHHQPARALFEMSNSTITPFMKSCNLRDDSVSISFDSPSAIAHRNGKSSSNIYRSKIYDSLRRQVSFGPTARLSFSGAGGGIDNHHDTYTAASTYNTNSNINRGSLYLEKLNENDEEYPQKVHRIGLGSDFMTAKANNDMTELMSPIMASNNSIETPNLLHSSSSSYTVNQSSALHLGHVYESEKSALYTKGISINDEVNKTNIDYGEENLESNNNTQILLDFSKLMLIFGSAYKYLNLYQCEDCINVLKLLPKNHFLSGFVYQLIGKAYYEMCDYRAALLSLKEMLRFEPFRIKGTEILSTVLWHLKKEKELCTLAQQIIEIDKFSPEPWCVVGNCFSLQKENDVAIRYFQRALQIDPSFTYAHTLCAHELVSNEDLDKAMKCFRTAILHDDRHYNAWYGLGTIYYRQEKYDLAEFHFRKALSINNCSSVLKCFLGMVLQAQANFQDINNFSSEDKFIQSRDKKIKEALYILNDAVASDPKNPQLRFQRAHVLTVVLNYLEANAGGDLVYNKSSTNVSTLDGKTYVEVLNDILTELEKVKELAPREPPVYIMLAQTYQKLGRTLDAVKCYNLAIDMDPKEGTGIKILLDAL